MIRSVAARTTRNIKKMVTGTLPPRARMVKSGRVPIHLSIHRPPKRATKITTNVRQPTCPATLARVRLKACCRRGSREGGVVTFADYITKSFTIRSNFQYLSIEIPSLYRPCSRHSRKGSLLPEGKQRFSGHHKLKFKRPTRDSSIRFSGKNDDKATQRSSHYGVLNGGRSSRQRMVCSSTSQ